MKEINNSNIIEYQCEECKLIYKEKDWAKKCQVWCKEHHSCNLEIIKHIKTNN